MGDVTVYYTAGCEKGIIHLNRFSAPGPDGASIQQGDRVSLSIDWANGRVNSITVIEQELDDLSHKLKQIFKL